MPQVHYCETCVTNETIRAGSDVLPFVGNSPAPLQPAHMFADTLAARATPGTGGFSAWLVERPTLSRRHPLFDIVEQVLNQNQFHTGS